MNTTGLADVRTPLGKYVEDVMTTHERVTITRIGEPAAVVISAQDLESLEETLYRARQGPANEDGPTVGVDVVASELSSRQRRSGT